MKTPTPSRILITGYSGFVGSYLISACRERYPQATLYGICQHKALHNEKQHAAVIPLQADIVAPEQVRRAVAEARPDLVFHLAGLASVATSWDEPALTLAINTAGAVHLFEALRAEGLAPRITLVGSGEQYGLVAPEANPIHEDQPARPINPYAASKAAQDLYGYTYFVAYGLPIIRVRPFNHFGPGQSAAFVVANFARQIARIEAGLDEPTLRVGNLQAQRDFLPVEDVVRAYLAVAERGRAGEAYNVGSGNARSIHETLEMLLAHARTPIAVQLDPARLRPVDAPILVADITRIRQHTGWRPHHDFAIAMRRTLDYWRDQVTQQMTSHATHEEPVLTERSAPIV